jgi:hypothetical protein
MNGRFAGLAWHAKPMNKLSSALNALFFGINLTLCGELFSCYAKISE